jgi:hypothetical protein
MRKQKGTQGRLPKNTGDSVVIHLLQLSHKRFPMVDGVLVGCAGSLNPYLSQSCHEKDEVSLLLTSDPCSKIWCSLYDQCLTSI